MKFHRQLSALSTAVAACFLGIVGSSAADAIFPPMEPRFSRHVIPVFSRLGCNAGACHGKVKGENGFRLSLFGVDPQQDHASLIREFAGRRVNLLMPEASLLLGKPTGAFAHAGGKLVDPSGPEYAILLRWLKQGAKLDRLEDSRVTGLLVDPSEQTIKAGEEFSLRVTATYADGSREEVTRLCRFEAVNREVVEISRDGVVKAKAVGDTAIVVRYGAEPVVANAIVPGKPIEFPKLAANNFVDEHVQTKLQRLNLVPAELCDDATFLRRVSLDIAGELPSPEEIRKFLADGDANKRAKKIDELLQRPGYTALWATKFCDILRPSGFDANFALIEPAENRRFYQWIRARLEENLGYDELAERILVATSREDRSYEAWIDEVLDMAQENAGRDAQLPTYAKRRTLDLYWQRKNATGVKGTVQVAHAFLGLRLECAQCHRHPHDVWTQDDLLSFANFFNQLKGARYPDKKEMPEAIAKMFEQLPKDAKKVEEEVKKLREQKLKEVTGSMQKSREELAKAKAAKDEERTKQIDEQLAKQTVEKEAVEQEVAKLDMQRGRMMEGPKRFGTNVRHDGEKMNAASVSSPLGSQRSDKFRLLGDSSPLTVAKDQDPRTLVAEWLRRPDNPFFTRALVNRVWAHYFGHGIIEPADQLSPLNPPSHPALLDELTRKFVEHKYDLKWLHRTIATSWAYQLSSSLPSGDPESAVAARRNFAFFQFRRLPAELLVDAVNLATGSYEEFPANLYLPEKAKAIEVAGVTGREDQEAALSYAFKIFGRPIRNTDVQCDCERDTNTTIVQTLYLANHPRVRAKIYNDDGRVAQVLRDVVDNEPRIEELFLISISRLPTPDERQTCLAYVGQRESSLRAFQDVLWSLLNTREFILNH